MLLARSRGCSATPPLVVVDEMQMPMQPHAAGATVLTNSTTAAASLDAALAMNQERRRVETLERDDDPTMLVRTASKTRTASVTRPTTSSHPDQLPPFLNFIRIVAAVAILTVVFRDELHRMLLRAMPSPFSSCPPYLAWLPLIEPICEAMR